LTLSPGNYNPATFASQLQAQFQTIASSFTITIDTNNGVIISANQNPAYAFKILTDDELNRGVYWYGASYHKNDLNSVNV
jgi:hypothetical protein